MPSMDDVENLGNAPHARFGRDARRLDNELSATLAEIVHRTDDDQITAAEAARERVTALERHLSEIQLLRELHFPGSTGSQPLAELKYWRTTMSQLLADGIAYQQGSTHPRARGQINVYRKLARDLGIEV